MVDSSDFRTPTDPNLRAPMPQTNGTRLHLKDLAVLIGMMAALWGALTFVQSLMYYSKPDGDENRLELKHHKELADPKIKALEAKGEKLETADDKLIEALHRIEIRQVRGASPRVRRELPVPPREPEP